MNKIIGTLFIAISIVSLTGCVSGKYITKTTGSYALDQAPLKLKMSGKARWTYYYITNSTSTTYYEDVKYKKKGDTVYMRPRYNYNDSAEESKILIPTYVVRGDTLKSIDWDLTYVKAKWFHFK